MFQTLLQKLLLSGQIPLSSELKLEHGFGHWFLPLTRVEAIYSRQAVWVYLVVKCFMVSYNYLLPRPLNSCGVTLLSLVSLATDHISSFLYRKPHITDQRFTEEYGIEHG